VQVVGVDDDLVVAIEDLEGVNDSVSLQIERVGAALQSWLQGRSVGAALLSWLQGIEVIGRSGR
ncbi:MAG: hypothetical protein ACI3ZK_06610, partial [Candidatus Cryptobacteroides sp.]